MSNESIKVSKGNYDCTQADARKVKVSYEDSEGRLHGRLCWLGSSKIAIISPPNKGGASL